MRNRDYRCDMPTAGARRGRRRSLWVDGGRDGPGTVLVPVVDGDATDRVLELAVDVARSGRDDVLVLLTVEKPRQTPAELLVAESDDDRRLGQHVRHAAAYGESRVPVGGTLRTGSNRGVIVNDAVDRYEADTVVVEGPQHADGVAALRRSAVDVIVDGADCDVVVASRADRLDAVASILLAVAGGPHSGLAIDVARAVAEAHDAWIEVFHVSESGAGTDDGPPPARIVEAADERLGEFERSDTWVYEADDAAEAIVEQSEFHDVTVLGTPQKGRLRQFVDGSTTGSVERGADVPVLTVRQRDARRSWTGRWLAKGT